MSEPLLKYRQPTAPQDILTEAVPARLYTEGSGLNLARAALFGVSLDKVKDIVELLRTYRGGRPNSLIMGGPMGWSWYSTLDTTHHGALAGPANAHRHSDLANIGIDDHHARDHATRHHSGGADALSLGSIAGNLTDAQHGSRTAANAHAHSHLSGIGVNDHHARDHALGGATHTADTLANLNLKISDANLDDQGAARPPQSHALGGAAHSADTFANLTGKVSDATLQKRGDVITDAEHGSRTQANAHAHSHLSGVTSDQHHARSHDHSLAADGTPIAVAGVPNLPASKITSGTFAVARGGIGLSTIAAGGILYASALDTLSRIAPSAANQVLRSTAANALQIAALVAADIPNLDTAKITSGRFGMPRMPDGTTARYLRAGGAGIDPAYAQPAFTEISGTISGAQHGTPVLCGGNFSAIDMRIRCRTADPASPADGELWLRTDL